MYEMLTGTLPFTSDNSVSVALMQLQNDAKSIREINPNIPVGLEQIVKRAMEKDTKSRYQTASEMLLDIEEFKRNPNIRFQQNYFVDSSPTKFATNPPSVPQAPAKPEPVKPEPLVIPGDDEDEPSRGKGGFIAIGVIDEFGIIDEGVAVTLGHVFGGVAMDGGGIGIVGLVMLVFQQIDVTSGPFEQVGSMADREGTLIARDIRDVFLHHFERLHGYVVRGVLDHLVIHGAHVEDGAGQFALVRVSRLKDDVVIGVAGLQITDDGVARGVLVRDAEVLVFARRVTGSIRSEEIMEIRRPAEHFHRVARR